MSGSLFVAPLRGVRRLSLRSRRSQVASRSLETLSITLYSPPELKSPSSVSRRRPQNRRTRSGGSQLSLLSYFSEATADSLVSNITYVSAVRSTESLSLSSPSSPTIAERQ